MDIVVVDIIAELRDRGIPAAVEHTGGGVATLFVGRPITTAGDEWYPTVAGPGNFHIDTDQPATFSTDDLSVCDDGDTDYATSTLVSPDATLPDIVDLIVEHYTQRSARSLTRDHCVRWTRAATAVLGIGYHPDTPFSDYGDPDRRPSFTSRKAAKHQVWLDRLSVAAERAGTDLYAVGLAVFRERGWV